MAVRTMAQMISAHASWPIQCPMLCTLAGMSTCSACDVVSTMPLRMKPVPRVAMNDGRPSVTVRKPFTHPITTPESSAISIASRPGTW